MNELEKNLLAMIASWESSMADAVRHGPLSNEEKTIIAAISECKIDVIKAIEESRLLSKLKVN